MVRSHKNNSFIFPNCLDAMDGFICSEISSTLSSIIGKISYRSTGSPSIKIIWATSLNDQSSPTRYGDIVEQARSAALRRSKNSSTTAEPKQPRL